jgi:hypothetical protein
MPTQRHETEFAEPIDVVFLALNGALAKRRWAQEPPLEPATPVPKVGCRYASRRNGVLRRGRVMECLRPVVLTLYESLVDSPCCVRLQLRWRVEPVGGRSSLRLHVRYQLNAAAALRRRHWARQIEAHCQRLLTRTRAQLRSSVAAQPPAAGVSGHNSGSNSIVTAKISPVSGKPIFR